MDNQQNVRRHSEPGFSLIEVILAIGMLSTVMISISSMFILGGRQMQSGKTMTQATVIAQDIMEMFEEQSYVLLYTGLGASDTDTTATAVSTTGGSVVEPWQAEIDEKFNLGSASVTALPMGPGTPDFGTAIGVRITVTVSWTEASRSRNVIISTVRF
jgi:type II secretory pathway pseudopilin PulG